MNTSKTASLYYFASRLTKFPKPNHSTKQRKLATTVLSKVIPLRVIITITIFNFLTLSESEQGGYKKIPIRKNGIIKTVSFRSYVWGFDLNKLKNLFGCKDPKAAEEIWNNYWENRYKNTDLLEHKEVLDLIENTIYGTHSPKESEDKLLFDFPSLLTRYLCRYNQDLIWPDERKESVGFNLRETFSKFVLYPSSHKIKIRNDILKLMKGIVLGRGLFTEFSCPYDHIYAYLSNGELKRVLNYIKENEEPFRRKGWKEYTHNWLSKLARSNKDLFYCWG